MEPMCAQCFSPISPQASSVTPGPQSNQGLGKFSFIPVAPNNLSPLLGILVSRRPEESLELPQVDVAEDVPRAGLPAPPLGQPPQRRRACHHGGLGRCRAGVHPSGRQQKVAESGSPPEDRLVSCSYSIPPFRARVGAAFPKQTKIADETLARLPLQPLLQVDNRLVPFYRKNNVANCCTPILYQ